MSFEDRADATVAALDFQELKLIYRVLHQHLAEHHDLMDTDFLIELQNYLQRRALAEKVDISDHGKWDEWIGHTNPASCDARVAGRRIIDGQS